MKTIIQLFAALGICFSMSAHAQEFPNAAVACLSAKGGKNYISVSMGKQAADARGQLVSKPGMVSLGWESDKTVWAKPEKQADGSFKVSFPGRKPMTIKAFRQLKDEYDTDPYLSIEEQGGRKFMCSQAMG